MDKEKDLHVTPREYLISGIIVLIFALLVYYLFSAFKSREDREAQKLTPFSSHALISGSKMTAASGENGVNGGDNNDAHFIKTSLNSNQTQAPQLDFETKLKQALQRGGNRNQPILFDKISFKAGSEEFSSNSIEQIKVTAKLLKSYKNVNIVIRGHSDSLGSKQRNSFISLLRSGQMKKALVKEGVNPRRIRIEGLGDAEPIATNKTPRGRMRNRRIDLIITDRK